MIVVHAPRVADGTDTAAGLRSVLVPSGIDAAHYGEQVDVPQVARKLTSWERFWARVRQALGLEAHDDPVPEGAAVGPGPWRPNPLRKKCPEYDQFLSVCQTIDDFNREAARWYRPEPRDPKYQKRLDKVEADAGRAFATADPEDLSRRKRPLGAWYRQFLRVRETAGQLAVDLSPRHEKASKWLFGLLFFALAVFHLYAHPVWHFDHSKPMEHLPALLAVYGLVWVVMIVWVVHLWWIRLDNRRHDYRALAEALRVRQAYALAGLSHSVADTYLSQLRTELAWVRRALQHLCPPSEFWKEHFRGLSDARKLDRMRQLEKDWVEYQEGQHQGRKKGEREKAVWHRRWGFGLAMAGLVVLALLPWVGPLWAVKFGPTAAATPSTTAPDAAKEAHPAEAPELPKPAGPAEEGHGLSYWLDPSRPINLLVFAGTLATILGGLSIAVSERQAHEELAKQYDRMHVVFRRGGRELDLVLDPEKRAALRTGTAATRPPPVGPPATVPAAEPVDFERAQRIVEELGREALQENAEWLLLRRSKPLELPLGT